jgi:hypothetical protein
MSFIAELSMVLAPVFALMYFITREELQAEKKKDPAWQKQQAERERLAELARESAEREGCLREQWKIEKKSMRKTLAAHTTSDFKQWRKTKVISETVQNPNSQALPYRQFLKDAFPADSEASEEELERRRQKLKTLIKLGKDRGFLTHSEINDHLPENIIDPEAIEGIISTFNAMGIAVYEHAPPTAATEKNYAPYIGGMIYEIGGKPHQWSGGEFKPIDPTKRHQR